MKIVNLKLINFRNYENLEVNFDPSLNIIYGKNGEGKTNLVEAIYTLALTRSFRNINDYKLIRDTETIAKVEGNISNKMTDNYKVIISKDGKKVKVNNNKIQKISDYISKIPLVLFHPDDLRFIKDTPSIRRKSLNISISEINPEYLRILNYYNKVLKQRNAYLKEMMLNSNKDRHYLDILDEKIITYGMFINSKRKDYIHVINNYLNNIFKNITGIDGLTIEYISDYNNLTKEEILKKYNDNLSKDMSFGKTNFGVHTDDFKFKINDKEVRDYGSEGEQKNVIIAYKFSELEIFKIINGNYPLLILDDLFSELDTEKIDNILKLLKPDCQTFITSTSLSFFNNLKKDSYKQIHIVNGKIEEV